MGKDEKKIAQECRARGMPLPNKMMNAPDLFLGLELYWDAFQDLVTCRTGAGFIPWTAINEYAHVHRLDEEQLDDLTFFLGQMNSALSKWQEKKNGNQPKPKSIRKTHVPAR